jgi:hypothetical protein
MPLAEYMKGGHGEREASVQVLPDAVGPVLPAWPRMSDAVTSGKVALPVYKTTTSG